MSYFVIMNVGTEQLYRKPGHYATASYPTLRGAKIACSKLNKQYGNTEQWIPMDRETFDSMHDPMVAVKSLMNGSTVMIRRSEVGGVNDPSTERFWSM